MTACVNKNYKRRAAGVVTASLVGALTLGGVSLAVATPALAAEMELQAADWNTGIKSLTATNGQGVTVKDPANASFAKGSGRYLVPTSVTNKFGTVTDLTDTTKWTFSYNKADGSAAAVTNSGTDFKDVTNAFTNGTFKDAGKYMVKVCAKGGTPDSDPTATFYFSVEQRSLAGAKVSGTVTYNGANQLNDIKFVDADGNELVLNTGTVKGDYTVTAGSDGSIADNTASADSSVTNAGSYKVTLTGQNGYAGSTVTVDVKVEKLDLSKAAVSATDVDETQVSAATLLGTKPSTEGNLVVAGYKGSVATINDSDFVVYSLSDPNNAAVAISGNSTEKGVYTAVIAAKDADTNKNVTGTSQAFTFTNYEVSAGDPMYDGKDFTQGVTIDLTKGEAWDESKLVFVPSGSRVAYAGATTVSYYDLDAKKAVDASALKSKGTYEVTIKATATKNEKGKWVGGTATATVKVQGTELWANEDVAFYLDGELAGASKDVKYDGSDFLSKVSAKVVDANGKSYEQGKDFELVATDKATGKEVESVTDAGDYEVKLKPLTFAWESSHTSGGTFDLTVKPVMVKDYEYQVSLPNGTTESRVTDGTKDQTVLYTGSAVAVPAVQYLEYADAGCTTPKYDEDGAPVYKTLDASLYNVVSIRDKKEDKVVKEMVADHTYEVTYSLSDEAGSNWSLKDNKFDVTVKKAQSFTDVQPDAWYAGAVEAAYQQFYVNGMSGTTLFAPTTDISRADAVGIIFNMAGGDAMEDDFVDQDGAYDTGFDDVNDHAYYAKALAWAHKAGIANGNGGNFRPADKITREDFACMLANYAKSKGADVSTDQAAAWEKVSDEDGVSSYAKASVAWAVNNGIMGKNGKVNATENIKRAEVAAMAVSYQPKNVNQEPRKGYDVNGNSGVRPGLRPAAQAEKK